MKKRVIKSKNNSVQNEGVALYNQIGLTLILCGAIGFMVLIFVYFLPQDYEKYNVALFFKVWLMLIIVLIFIGLFLLYLGKYSKKYQHWVEKEFKSYQNQVLKNKFKK